MFKVTDLIVAKGEHDLNCLLPEVVQVHSINEVDVYCEDDSGMGCWILKSHLHLWRYAESEEIAAGHRIDTNTGVTVITPSGTSKVKGGMTAFVDMGDDSHIENHVSPNCKKFDERVR